MRSFSVVGAAALALFVMPVGAKASIFVTSSKASTAFTITTKYSPVSASIASILTKVDAIKATPIPVSNLGNSKAIEAILTVLNPAKQSAANDCGSVVATVKQIVAQIFGAVTCDPKPTTGNSGHLGGSAGGKDCDPKPGNGSHETNPGNSGGTANGGSGNGNTGNGGSQSGGNANAGTGGTGTGGGTAAPPSGGNTGTTNPGAGAGGDVGAGGNTGGSGDTGATNPGTTPGSGDTGPGDVPGIGGGNTETGSPVTGGGSGDGGMGSIPGGGLNLGDGRPIGGGSTQPPADSGAGAVPEPASWMTMILGFGVVGASLRSRRRGLRIA